MRYRTSGKLDFGLATLGFGTLRLRILVDGENRPTVKRIDAVAATKTPHRAIERGAMNPDTVQIR